MRGVLLAVLLCLSTFCRGQEAPAWFAASLLHLPDEVAEAARERKRVMLYFAQDGCPYCKRMVEVTWAEPRIAQKMQQRFVSLALNIWGDREVTWTDGTTLSEKQLAARLKVQFTPTLVFLDEKGAIARRINGYYPPKEFEAAIDNVEIKRSGSQPLTYQSFFMAAPLDLRRKAGGKPLAVLFEASPCEGCDELHRVGFANAEVLAQVRRFDVAQLSLAGAGRLTTPEGKNLSAAAWAEALNVTRVPTMVLFDNSGREVLRKEAYFRPFHIAASLEYVSSGAYRQEPSFQRFLQAKAAAMKARGQAVELWE